MGYILAIFGSLLVAATSADYVGPNDFNRQPSTSYGTPAQSYSAPTNSYGAPSNSYGAPANYDGDHYKGDERPKSYQFGYAVKDHASGNDFGRHETSDGDTVKGQYRVQLPDGRTQVVTYTADWKHGFQAKVTYEGVAFYPDQHKSNQGGYDYTPASNHGNSYNHGSSGNYKHGSSNNYNHGSSGTYNQGGNYNHDSRSNYNHGSSYDSNSYSGSSNQDSYSNFGSDTYSDYKGHSDYNN